jgi:bis(5'-nucleosyl)-tetraphosphatase (symmetrical)
LATYAIGDLQGCDAEFEALLSKLNFTADDKLWLLGDLVNRGPASLALLRRVMAMQDQCTIVLGNHDLHFLAIYFGGHNPGRSDTLADLLAAPDVEQLAHWLRRQKLLHIDNKAGYAMAHAGIPHIWSMAQAQHLAQEVERVIAGRDNDLTYVEYFEQMYGNEPDCWDETLEGMRRYRMITNYLTRMRLMNDSGTLEFAHKGASSDAPTGWKPWFEHHPIDPQRLKILFGHWAALDGDTARDDILCLDTGCVWGRDLTAMNLANGTCTAVSG